MSNRKQGSNNTVEVSGARTKLDDVLKDLVEKAEERYYRSNVDQKSMFIFLKTNQVNK